MSTEHSIFYMRQDIAALKKDVAELKQDMLKYREKLESLDVFDYNYDYKALAKKILEDKYPAVPEIV